MAETVKKSKRAEVISYTEKEKAAIEKLMAHKGEHLTAIELGIPTAILTSLMKKANDERPMADGEVRFMLNKEKVTREVKTVKEYTAYFAD